MNLETTMIKKIEAELPAGWGIVEYSELNHHITLINELGDTMRLDAEHMVKYQCSLCDMELFARSNHGPLRCHCGGEMLPVWGSAKICFVPKHLEENGRDN